MKLNSVNMGLPREITVGGKTVRTSIWKNPVQSFAAPLRYPHYHKAGKTIFENAFGMPMLD